MSNGKNVKMASEQHVVEVKPEENAEKPTRKIEKTVLDNFSNLVKPQEKLRIKSSVNLLRHLIENEKEENINELNYALGRIIRGLGSTTVSARTGFYTALVALINFRDDITIDDIFKHLEKQLHKAGSNTKGENADVCLGQILSCGAITRSKLWTQSSEEETKKVLELMLKTCKQRTYLVLVAYTFIINTFAEVDDKRFRKIFQLVKEEFSKPWADQNVDSLYLLLCVRNKNSSYVTGKFLQKTVGTKEIICPESLEELCSVLMTILRVTGINHPIYELICKDLATSEHLTNFVLEVDKNLQRPNRNKQLIATKIYSIILQHIQNTSLIPDILTKNFIQQMLNYFRTLKGKEKDSEFQQNTHKFFETVLEALKREGVAPKTKIAVLKKLLLYPGTFIFEKVTKSKLIQQITAILDEDGVKMLGAVYEGVIKGTERIDSVNAHNQNWLNNDRLYAAHLLIKLLNHAVMKNENDWKMERLTVIMALALFKADNGINIGSELAASLKSAFFGALDLKLSKLEDLQLILSHLVKYLDTKLTPDNLETVLRNPVTVADFKTWEKTIEVIAKIEAKKKKSGLRTVFLTLFLHMGLQLFNDAKLASDSLKELFICYKKTRKSRTNSESLDETEDPTETKSDDPAWIEVVTDLFLNLLSHNYHLLRSLIKCVFPHLCPYMNATTIHQMLSVIDPKNEDNPLSKHDESSDDDDNSEEEDVENETESEEEEVESEDEEEQENESVNDKLRMALHKVLSKDGYETDEESVDLDQLSEGEGEKLDTALAEAFKQFRPNHGKRKKQNRDQETLTHFRVRVLDLIDTYVDSTPSMLLTLEIMLPLLQAVEFSIRDVHQKPLHDRLKTSLKKLTSLKKFGDTYGVDEVVLGELLRSLLEKGTKTLLIIQEMGVQIAECCIFVIRCSDLLMSLDATPKKVRKNLKNCISELVREELHNYFHKRDCLTPYVLFKNTVQLTWDGALTLVPPLLAYVFSDEVKPFKKSQGLELLKLFYTNHRYLILKPEKTSAKLAKDHVQFFENVNALFKSLCENPQKNVKEKFISNLFSLLSAMKTGRLNIETNWSEVAQNVREYRSFVSFSKDAKSAFNRLCNQLGVSHIVQMKPKTVSVSNAKDEDDSINLDKKKSDKRKKKTKSKEKLKLKKEAKELRMKSLSEGFRDLDFASAKDVEMNEIENEVHSNVNGKVKYDRKRKNSETVEEEEIGTSESVKKQKKCKKKEVEDSVASKSTKSKKKRKSTSETVGISDFASEQDDTNNSASNKNSKFKKKKNIVK